MGSYAKAKGRGKSPSFIMLRHDMMDSPAWQSLSANAQSLWAHITRRYNGNNNGEISLSCREAATKIKVSPNTASRAFIELEDRGFIKIAVFAGFVNKHRTATRWVLTHVEYAGKKSTNEWRIWKPENDAKN